MSLWNFPPTNVTTTFLPKDVAILEGARELYWKIPERHRTGFPNGKFRTTFVKFIFESVESRSGLSNSVGFFANSSTSTKVTASTMVRLLRLWPAVSHRVVSFSFYGIVIFVFFLYQVSTTLSGFSLTLNIHLFRLFSSWHHSIWTSRDSHRLLVPTGCRRYFSPPKKALAVVNGSVKVC